jgi:hypothetical protein
MMAMAEDDQGMITVAVGVPSSNPTHDESLPLREKL